MMNSEKKSFATWTRWVVTAIVLLATSARALQNDSEGEEWTKWNQETRTAYIRAYVSGLDRGYGAGCHNGVLAVLPPRNGKADLKAIGKCWNEYPLNKTDPIQYVPLITKFYATYPDQRYLDIWKVLYQAAKGGTIEVIHEHFLHSSYP
jgi:hypothetical protein